MINVSTFCDSKDASLISMSPVPQCYHTAIDNHTRDVMSFHHNMVQFQVHNRAIIYDIDSQKELSALEGMDQLMDPDKACVTGFNMHISKREVVEEDEFVRFTELAQNEFSNLSFMRTEDVYTDGTIKKSICGTLYRTYSELDLLELQETQDTIEKEKKMRYIDHETIVAIYQGHTIFSIFQNRVRVVEQILSQLEDQEFEEEDDIYGLDVENSYLKRLYRTLTLPTADWKDRKGFIAKVHEEEESPLNTMAKV